jgi:hypothetical protein
MGQRDKSVLSGGVLVITEIAFEDIKVGDHVERVIRQDGHVLTDRFWVTYKRIGTVQSKSGRTIAEKPMTIPGTVFWYLVERPDPKLSEDTYPVGSLLAFTKDFYTKPYALYFRTVAGWFVAFPHGDREELSYWDSNWANVRAWLGDKNYTLKVNS